MEYTFSNAPSKYSKRFTKLPSELEAATADIPEDLTEEKWHKLCDLFNDKKWKVNHHKLFFQLI